MPDYVKTLRSFDSHERGILLQWALGRDFELAEAVRAELSSMIQRDIPGDAFVAMDYTLDWLFAAIATTSSQKPPIQPHPWPPGEALKASIEDVDLLVAWKDAAGNHTLLLEAKGFTGWTNKQMSSKAARLAAIFEGEIADKFDVHFVLCGPSPSKGLDTSTWPAWMRRGDRVHFQAIPDPGPRWYVQRCNIAGDPQRVNPTHWRLVQRTWASTASGT